MVNVVKWDGRKEPFKSEKIERTLVRVGAPPGVAEKIAGQIEEEAYEGIKTEEILEIAFKRLEKYEPAVSLRRDLRAALGEIPSMPEFEEYVRIVLRAHGYDVLPNRTVRGFCVDHEIDGIADRDGEVLYLEVKHHVDPHTYTPFEVSLAVKSKLDDMRQGFKEGRNERRFDGALIVCNTRLTEHAKRYAECVGLEHLGWNEPPGKGFDRLVEDEGLYPVTILKSLSEKERDTLSEGGILTLKQLVNSKIKRPDMSSERMLNMIEEADEILNLDSRREQDLIKDIGCGFRS